MGVLAPSQNRIAESHVRAQLPKYCAAGLYAFVVGATIWRHEPWADEAQSWLLARDSSLIDLWTKLLHYEGTPGLWHTLLHFLIRFGLPYSGANILSGVLGFAAVCVLLWRAPLPTPIRIILPFTFYFCYQYSVLARSYALLPLLLFLCATLYNTSGRRLGLFTFLLCLMGAVSVHGFALSVSLWMAFHLPVARCWSTLDRSDRKRVTLGGIVYVLVMTFIAASAWPAKDVAYPIQRDLSLRHLFEASAITIREAFTGAWIPSIGTIVLSIPFLWQGGGLLVFGLSSAFLCGIAALIYTQVWHAGLLFLAWLFAIWVSAINIRPTVTVLTALLIVIVFQCNWTVRSIQYDWNYPYSGSFEAARSLRQLGLPRPRIYGVGFACVAIQPYFLKNVFANFNDGKGPAFWDLSTHNRVNDIGEPLFARDPDYVMVGYKRDVQKIFWANVTRMSGYRLVRHFDGNLFWRTSILEAESFDLYQRGHGGSDVHTADTVNMNDPNAAQQLISGFYSVESDAWRWTAREFSVALRRQVDAAHRGARLLLNLVIPEAQIRRLGPITLRAQVGASVLEAERFSKAGNYVYSRDVPAEALHFDTVLASFTLDKAAPASEADLRELGVVVTSVALHPK